MLINTGCQALSFWPAEANEPDGNVFEVSDWLWGPDVIVGFIVVVASLYLLVVLGFLDGTPGPNRFGRSPKGIGGDPADKAAEVFS